MQPSSGPHSDRSRTRLGVHIRFCLSVAALRQAAVSAPRGARVPPTPALPLPVLRLWREVSRVGVVAAGRKAP